MAASRNGSKSRASLLQFTKPLKDTTCKQGENIVLECYVQGIPVPEIKWEKGNIPLSTSRNLYSDKKGGRCRLTIKACTKKDAGKYTCIASNRSGSVKTVATLQVEGASGKCNKALSTGKKSVAPSFLIAPSSKIVDEGEVVRFLCSVAGLPEPSVRWCRGKDDINTGGRFCIMKNENVSTLEIRSAEKEDAGKYMVTLENSQGKVTSSATLEVQAKEPLDTCTPPHVIRPLTNGTAVDGMPFVISCEFTGHPEPTIQWHKDAQPMFSSEEFKVHFDGRNAVLAIEEIYPEDEGHYLCVARNEWGEVDTGCWITVKADPPRIPQLGCEPPIFTQTLQSTEVHEGDSVTFTVKVKGTRPVEVVWVHNDKEVKDCSDFSYFKSPDGITYSLLIRDVFHEDGGLYVCEAYNNYGHTETVCKLTVKDRFNTEETTLTNGITKGKLKLDKSPGETETVQVNGDVIIHCESDEIHEPSTLWTGQEVKLVGDICSRRKRSTEGSSRESSLSSDHAAENGRLSPDLTKDNNVNTETKKLDTVPATSTIPVPRPNPAQILRGPQSISVLRGDNVTLRTHFIGYPSPSVKWIKGGKLLTSNNRITISIEECMSVLTLHDAVADDSGKYVVTVENSGGSDCHFASVAVEGPPDPPAGRPNISNVTNHSLVISWYGSAYDGGSVITGYIVEMCTVPEERWSRVSAACHSTSYVLRDLLPEREYKFRIRAENVHGVSPPSKESDSVRLNEKHKGDDDEGFALFEHKAVEIEDGLQFPESYTLKEEVGKGRFGVVYKCLENATDELRAAKVVRCVKARDKSKAREEINVMNKLQHPKLLQLIAAFESPREMILVVEYISGGELFERITADDFVLTEDECVLFMRQICEGVDYMHDSSIIHLDLKPENILCKTKTSHQIKIIDFGLAKQYNPEESLRVLFGTPEFVAPEVISYEPVSLACDMWSVGVICYVLLSGLSPFMGETDAETFINVTRSEYDFEDEAFDSISDEAKSFINSLLVKRPEKRMTANECLQHNWLIKRYRSRKSIQLSTDKLKRFCVRRKWQKTGTAIRALGRMVSLSGVGTSWSSLGSSSTSESDTSSTAPSLGRGANGHDTIDESDEGIVDREICTNGECIREITFRFER